MTDKRDLYPLDVSTLTKGQVLEHEELKTILHVEPGNHEKWRWALLRLREQITNRRRDLGLPMLTTRTHQGKLIVCTDEEAAKYNRHAGKLKLKGYRRAVTRNLAVDASKLTAEDRQAHERTLMIQAMMMRGIRQVQHGKKPQITQERVTPRMMAGPVGA